MLKDREDGLVGRRSQALLARHRRRRDIDAPRLGSLDDRHDDIGLEGVRLGLGVPLEALAHGA
jgi:hypothetical protein